MRSLPTARLSLLILAALAQTGLLAAQPTKGAPRPGAAMPRGERPAKDVRPVGPAPGMFYATALGPTSTRVVWSVVPAATGYQLYRSAGGSSAVLLKTVSQTPNAVNVLNFIPKVTYTSGGVPKLAGAVIGAPPVRFVDTALRPRSAYTYVVVSTYSDSGPYRNATSQVAVSTPSVLPPAWISATPTAGTMVTLNWQLAPDATGYKVFRDDVPITTQPVRGTSLVDQGLKPGVYTYSVISYFAEGAGDVEGELTPRPRIQVILSRCSSP
ncbi:MAG: fibronectin type III domain-containing protein [Gemmatimonadota bacterium]|nr:fibronectin type III domain-containing protein [Gemmatimonadota bacterium]